MQIKTQKSKASNKKKQVNNKPRCAKKQQHVTTKRKMTTKQQYNKFSTTTTNDKELNEDDIDAKIDAMSPTIVAEKLGSKTKIYTKTGDRGTTLLYNMQRLPKNADYFEALGHVDELNSFLGLAREHFWQLQQTTSNPHKSDLIDVDEQLTIIQSRLFDIGSAIATPKKHSTTKRLLRVAFDAEENIQLLEKWIDQFDAQLPPLRLFILPSGGLAASTLHVSRTVCRRAERSVVPLVQDEDCDPSVLQYLNRLSDYLFIAARYCSRLEGKPEITWRKAINPPAAVADAPKENNNEKM